MRATKAIIHLDNLRYNIGIIRSLLKPETKICAAVKADAYGHGAVEVSKAAIEEGVSFLGVATSGEAEELRNAGITCPILLLTLPIPEEIPLLVEFSVSPLISDAAAIESIERECRRQKKRAAVHLDIDTGMGRVGCTPDAALAIARRIVDSPSITLEGVCTHFAAPEELNGGFTEQQGMLFFETVKRLRRNGIDTGIVHAANSGAILTHPQWNFDMVRPGILLYGYYPSRVMPGQPRFLPVMELETRIVFMKRVPAGTPISYGMTYRTSRETVIATINVGYGDGYSRLLSNKGRVLINGKSYPVVGRVCMDQTMVNVSHLDDVAVAALHQKGVRFGPDPEGCSAWDIAELTGTIPYEVTCNVNKRVPRVFLDKKG
jgi:alanine racemase